LIGLTGRSENVSKVRAGARRRVKKCDRVVLGDAQHAEENRRQNGSKRSSDGRGAELIAYTIALRDDNVT
jgi:hypothetical protein